MWGWAITNFVWWIGIGHRRHADFRRFCCCCINPGAIRSTGVRGSHDAVSPWRAPVCFRCSHLGRPWLFLLAVPVLPIRRHSAAVRQSAGVGRVRSLDLYGTVSLLFWYVGMISDLATLRDRPRNRWAKATYGTPGYGLARAASHWQKYETASLLAPVGWLRRWLFRCIRLSAWTSQWPSSPDGTALSFLLTSLQAPFHSGFAMVLVRWRFLSAPCTGWAILITMCIR